MREIETSPFIYRDDILLVAETMGIQLSPNEIKTIAVRSTRNLHRLVVSCVENAINGVVRNRDLPGQQKLWEE